MAKIMTADFLDLVSMISIIQEAVDNGFTRLALRWAGSKLPFIRLRVVTLAILDCILYYLRFRNRNIKMYR